MVTMPKKYSEASVKGRVITVIAPELFYAAPVKNMGLGLFCNVDLDQGDVWWACNLNDPRFT